MSLDQDQSHSELSHVSLGDNQGNRMQSGRDSSDSENSDNAMDETPESLQDDFSSLESQPSSLVANNTAAPPENTQDIQGERTAANVEEITVRQSDGTPDTCNEGKSNAQKSTKDETLQTASADAPAQNPDKEDTKSTTSQSGSGKGTKTNDPKNQKTDIKNSKNKKDPGTTRQPTLDQNANVEPNVKKTEQHNQKGKTQQDQLQKQTEATKPKMVSGPQTSSKVMRTKLYGKLSLLRDRILHFILSIDIILTSLTYIFSIQYIFNVICTG